MASAADEKDAIRELMARYCHALDDCRFGEVAALFAVDGEWSTTYGSARGRAQIEALLASVVPKPGEGPQRKHYITNILIKLDKEGEPQPQLSDFGIGVLSDRTLLQRGAITETGFTESVMFGNDSSRTGTRLSKSPRHATRAWILASLVPSHDCTRPK